MRTRRHHNNHGRRQIQRGQTQKDAERIAKKMGVPVRPEYEIKEPDWSKVPDEQVENIRGQI